MLLLVWGLVECLLYRHHMRTLKVSYRLQGFLAALLSHLQVRYQGSTVPCR